MNPTLTEICAVACAEAFRGDGEIMASPMGAVPSIGARVAKATFSPDLLLTDGVASIVANRHTGDRPVHEGWMPYRRVFHTLWSGRRHVMMGATQIDRYGNTNISCLGDHAKPKVQLLGARGGPGNTLSHTTSYFIGGQSRRTFVPKVDFVSGVGYDRAMALGERAARFHEIRVVVTNLGVFDFDSPDRQMRLASLHPGVTLQQVVEATGFDLAHDDDVAETPLPTTEQLRIIRDLVNGGDSDTPVDLL